MKATTSGNWLQERGEMWITRLADEHSLHVKPVPWQFLTLTRAQLRPYGATYGLTQMRPPVVFIQDELLALRAVIGDEKAVPLIDEMLVHELIHATGVRDHGAEFKKRYGKVYPWSKPGPVTDFDPGTPRRVLWGQIKRALP
jgi:hypothetical protein